MVAPEKEPDNRFGGAQAVTFTIAIPGQKFFVQTALHNEGAQASSGGGSRPSRPSDGKNWAIQTDKAAWAIARGRFGKQAQVLRRRAGRCRASPRRFTRAQSGAALLRPDRRTLSQFVSGAYPLSATARLEFQWCAIYPAPRGGGQSAHRRHRHCSRSPDCGPGHFSFRHPFGWRCSAHLQVVHFLLRPRSNVKGPAKGSVRLRLPDGWSSSPAQAPFSFARDGDSETITFQVTPHALKAGNYEIRAVADYDGKTYEEGFRLVGYAGLRPYPSYHPATYKAVGVDVQTAQNLHVGFLPGTGDDVPRALEDLGRATPNPYLPPISKPATFRTSTPLCLGVRAYAVRPELRSANGRLLNYVSNGGVLIVQYNVQNFDPDYGPYPLTVGNAPRVVDESSPVKILEPQIPLQLAQQNHQLPTSMAGKKSAATAFCKSGTRIIRR